MSNDIVQLDDPADVAAIGAALDKHGAVIVHNFLADAVLAAFNDSIRGDRELADALEAPCLGRMPRGGV